MSSLIFRNAVRQPRQLQSAVMASSNASSVMERELNKVKQNSGNDAKELNKKLNFGNHSRKIKGIFISYDGKNIHKNEQVNSNDTIITFVGTGYTQPKIPTIKNIYFSDESKFVYMPISEPKQKSISIVCNVNAATDEIKQYLQKIRIRFLKSSLQSRYGNFIHTAFADNPPQYSQYGYLKPGGFGYTGKTVDSPTNNLVFNTQLYIPSYKISKQEYLDSIDRDYAAEALTLNTTGYSSVPLTTLEDTLQPSDAKNRSVHIIGLPYIENIMAHYDFNLVQAKALNTPSNPKNSYYYLHDIEKAQETNFSNIIQEDGEKYSFNWGKYDIRNLITNKKNVNFVQQCSIRSGYMNQDKLVKEASSTLKKEESFPDIKKIYGNTVYYNLGEPVAKIKVKDGKTNTLFAKFNLRSFSETGQTPFVSLLSYNVKQDQNSNSSFNIYLDNEGYLFSKIIDKTGKETITSLNFNIGNTLLYTDGKFKFDDMNDTLHQNLNRSNFNIIAFTITPHGTQNKINLKIDLLKKHEKTNPTATNQSNKIQLETQIERIFDKDILQIENLSNEVEFDFITQMNPEGSSVLSEENFSGLNKNILIELSDFIFYNEDLNAKKFGNSNYINLTMDYLYRKYLTENERHKGGFDEFFKSKY